MRNVICKGGSGTSRSSDPKAPKPELIGASLVDVRCETSSSQMLLSQDAPFEKGLQFTLNGRLFCHDGPEICRAD